jgi:hypothetical protein
MVYFSVKLKLLLSMHFCASMQPSRLSQEHEIQPEASRYSSHLIEKFMNSTPEDTQLLDDILTGKTK